ncbi:MAG: outer membrane protein assembly factor BamE [Candidatus Protistobacter heckmanni]|nr:outer membrane protein assembly factor BamE [Candidatus Protistobacter heckmanni]
MSQRNIRAVQMVFMPAAVSLLLSACGTYDSASKRMLDFFTLYRITVVQGNFVSRESVAQLKAGMTREQVRFLLGTPLLTDIFHADRWDYYFSFRHGSETIVQQHHFTVFFEGDKLVRFGGNDLPSEYELIQEIDGLKQPARGQIGKEAPAKAPAAAPASSPASAPSSDAKPAEQK